MNPEAVRLYAIAKEITTDVPTNAPRLLEAGMAVMDATWSHHPATVDAQGRFEQLDAMRTFCVVAAKHVPEQAAPMLERARQVTNTIRLYFDDPGAVYIQHLEGSDTAVAVSDTRPMPLEAKAKADIAPQDVPRPQQLTLPPLRIASMPPRVTRRKVIRDARGQITEIIDISEDAE